MCDSDRPQTHWGAKFFHHVWLYSTQLSNSLCSNTPALVIQYMTTTSFLNLTEQMSNKSSTPAFCWSEVELQHSILPRAGSQHITSVSLYVLFPYLSQAAMEKMASVGTVSGRTMFCLLDAPANAISVCRDATQVFSALFFLFLLTVSPGFKRNA